MKPIIFALFFTLLPLALSEYPRMKFRGPSPYPKPPPYHQPIKKWQQQPPRPPPARQRQPIRAPIPVRMPPHHSIQMGAGSINRPVSVAAPVRSFWKNTQTTFRTVPEHFVTSAPVLPKKTFQSPPPKTFQSSPPLPPKTFQSSPAILAQEYDFQLQSNNVLNNIQTIKQIGEKGPIHTIPAPNLSLADRPAGAVEGGQKAEPGVEKQYHQHPEVATYVQIQKAHQYQVTEAPELSKQTAFKTYYETHAAPSDLYQYHLINPSTITLPLLPNYQQQNYVEPVEQFAMDKSIQEEPRKDPSTHLTATYNLEPEVAESIVQSQYVQNYFDTRDNANSVPDAKPSENGTIDGYYVTLPNKEAVEKLASLQAAGQLNSSLQNGKGVAIYVPEEREESREDGDQLDEGEELYDDYAQDDLITEEMRRGGEEAFGHRVKAK